MPKQETTSVEEKLDTIIACIHRMDRRDRIRTWGGFIRGLIGLIPIILLLWSTWYFIKHGDELMMKMTKYAAESAASMTQEKSANFMQQFQLMFPGGSN